MTGLRDTLISESTLVCSIPRHVSLASAFTPFLPPLYLRISLSLTRPRSPLSSSRSLRSHWLLSILLSSPDVIPSRVLFSLSSRYTRSMSLFITRHPELDSSFSLCAAPYVFLPLQTSLPLLSDSFVLSFFHRVIPSRFRVPYAFLLSLTVLPLVHAVPPQSYRLPCTL